MARPDRTPGGLASVDNALALLPRLQERGELRITDAAQELSVAPSTVHRLMQSLQQHGFAVQDAATKTYRAGPALGVFGMRQILLDAGSEVLDLVVERTQETAHLAVLEGAHVRYLLALEGTRAVRVGSRAGATLPAHCSAVGKVLLCQLPPQRLTQLYPPGRKLARLTPTSLASSKELYAELDLVRRTGVAENDGESEDGVAAIAVAIPGAGAALGCAAPKSRMSTKRRREIVAVLHLAQRQLEHAIGLMRQPTAGDDASSWCRTAESAIP